MHVKMYEGILITYGTNAKNVVVAAGWTSQKLLISLQLTSFHKLKINLESKVPAYSLVFCAPDFFPACFSAFRGQL